MGPHTTNMLDNDIGRKANTATKNERNDARQPPCLWPTGRHHRVLASGWWARSRSTTAKRRAEAGGKAPQLGGSGLCINTRPAARR
jgi:hypothetical protein